MEGTLTGRAPPAENAQGPGTHSHVFIVALGILHCAKQKEEKRPLGEQGKVLLSLFKQCVII